MGEVMVALPKLVSAERNSACADVTLVFATATSACARSNVAAAVSNSDFAGNCPPEVRFNSRKRAKLVCASFTVALACRTFASAEASAALSLVMVSFNCVVLRCASACPFFTTAFSSTNTSTTVPESSVPISTSFFGCKFPVAVTVTASLPVFTSVVLNTVCVPLCGLARKKYPAPPANAAAIVSVSNHLPFPVLPRFAPCANTACTESLVVTVVLPIVLLLPRAADSFVQSNDRLAVRGLRG